MSDIDRLQTTGHPARAERDVAVSTWAGKRQEQKSIVQSLSGVAQDNPVPAALIAVGALWLFAGGSRLSLFDLITGAAGTASAGTARAGSAAASVAGDLGRTVGRGAVSAADVVRGASGAALRQASDAGGSLTNAAGEVVSRAAHAASSAYAVTSGGIGRAAQGTLDAAQTLPAAVTQGGIGLGRQSRTLAEQLERQPLLLAALGTVIGAGFAMALPTTDIENRALGQVSDELKSQVQDVVSHQVEQAITTAETVLDEGKRAAQAEGLTPSAAADAVRGLGDKIAQVAKSASAAAKPAVTSGNLES